MLTGMLAAQAITAGLALAAQAGLIGLAGVHAFSGRYHRALRLFTWLVIAAILVVSPLVAWSAADEITRYDYPWTRPGKPLGTYAAPSALGVGMVALDAVLFFVAAATAIVRPRLAVGLLMVVAILGAVGVIWTATDPTAPSGNALIAFVVGPTLPAITTAALVRSTWTSRRFGS